MLIIARTLPEQKKQDESENQIASCFWCDYLFFMPSAEDDVESVENTNSCFAVELNNAENCICFCLVNLV